MGEVQLYSRNQLPPGQVGLAKPPYALAERPVGKGGFINAGQAVAEFSGGIFQELIETRANNEFHTFLGQNDTRLQEFENWVQANPDKPLEDIEKERDKMIADIESYSEGASTKPAQEKIKNFLLDNKNLIIEKANHSIKAIGMKREVDKFDLRRDIYVKTGNKAELNNLYKNMPPGFLDPETAKLQQEKDNLILDRNLAEQAKKQAEDNAYNDLLDVADVFNKEGKDGWAKAQEVVNDSEFQKRHPELDSDQIRELTYKVNAQANLSKELLERTRQKENLDIYNAIQKNDPNVVDLIQNSHLSIEDRKSRLQELKDKAEGKTKITNQIEKDKLYKDAMNIWTGAIDEAEFTARLNENAKNLNQSDFDELLKLSKQNFEEYDKGILKKIDEEAENLLIEAKQSDLILLAKAAEQAQTTEAATTALQALLQMQEQNRVQTWNLNRFRKAYNSWLAKNPESKPQEKFVNSRIILSNYQKDFSELKKQYDTEMKVFTAAGEKLIDKQILDWSEGEKKEYIKLLYGLTDEQINNYLEGNDVNAPSTITE